MIKHLRCLQNHSNSAQTLRFKKRIFRNLGETVGWYAEIDPTHPSGVNRRNKYHSGEPEQSPHVEWLLQGANDQLSELIVVFEAWEQKHAEALKEAHWAANKFQSLNSNSRELELTRTY